MSTFRRAAALALAAAALAASAAELPTHDQVQQALRTVVAEKNGGLGTHMWATIVDRDGVVRVVTFSGKERGDQWLGSRVISAQKAYGANAFCLPALAISTGQLYAATQPGGSLYGIQFSNPIDAEAANDGDVKDFGAEKDPMVGERVGGICVFGGGLGLYAADGALVGGMGVSGDTAVADHVICWKLRHALGLDYVPKGLSATGDDNLVLDIKDGKSASGWGHPETSPESTAIVDDLPKTVPLAKRRQ